MLKTGVIILLIWLTSLVGCASQEERPASGRFDKNQQAVLHVIQGAELRNKMQRLNNLVSERNLTEPELDNRRRNASSLISDVAKGAESSLDCILSAEWKLNLDTARSAQFHDLADELRVQVKALTIQARTHQFDDTPVTLEKIGDTCRSCHALFLSP